MTIHLFWIVVKLTGKINIAEKYREFYRQIDGVDYIGILIGTYPALIMRDPELIMRILVKDFKYFHDRGFHNSEKDLLGNNLFFMRNPKWKLLRNKTVSVFSTAKMKAYFEIMGKKHRVFFSLTFSNVWYFEPKNLSLIQEWMNISIPFE